MQRFTRQRKIKLLSTINGFTRQRENRAFAQREGFTRRWKNLAGLIDQIELLVERKNYTGGSKNRTIYQLMANPVGSTDQLIYSSNAKTAGSMGPRIHPAMENPIGVIHQPMFSPKASPAVSKDSTTRPQGPSSHTLKISTELPVEVYSGVFKGSKGIPVDGKSGCVIDHQTIYPS